MTAAMVFFGGGVGALLRFVLSRLVADSSGRIWAGTLAVNLLGCLILFALYKVIGNHRLYAPLVITGFLGALTTFSTFSLDLVRLIQEQKYLEAVTVLLLNVVFGVALGLFFLKKGHLNA